MKFRILAILFSLCFLLVLVPVHGRKKAALPLDPVEQVRQILEKGQNDLLIDPEADTVLVFGLQNSMASLITSFLARTDHNLIAVQDDSSESGSGFGFKIQSAMETNEIENENADEELVPKVVVSDKRASPPTLFYIVPDTGATNRSGNISIKNDDDDDDDARGPSSSTTNRLVFQNFFIKQILERMNRYRILLVADESDFPKAPPVARNGTCPPIDGACPSLNGKCLAVEGFCPMMRNICPPLNGKICAKNAPVRQGSCPLVGGKCPVVDPREPVCGYPIRPPTIMCPPVDGRCPSHRGQCPFPRPPPGTNLPEGQGFAHLLRQVIGFFSPELDAEFFAGTSLVITNVDSTLESKEELEYQRTTFFSSLRKYDLRALFPDLEEFRMAASFVTRLFDKDPTTGNMERIGIFPKPEKAGTLSSSRNMEQAQKYLDDMIFNSNSSSLSRFATKNSNLVPRIPPASITEQMSAGIKDLEEGVTEEIGSKMSFLSQKLMDFYSKKLNVDKSTKNLTSVRDPVKIALERWTKIGLLGKQSQFEGAPFLKPSNLAVTVALALRELRVEFPVRTITENLKRAESLDIVVEFYSSFPTVLSNQTLWTLHLEQNFTTPLQHRITWLDFLIEAWPKLSNYDIQRNRKLYNVADLTDWGRPGENIRRGISCTKLNIDTCLQKLHYTLRIKSSSSSTPLLDSLKVDPALENEKISELNQLLEVTLRDEMICTHDSKENTLLVRGNFIFLSQVLSNTSTSCWKNGLSSLQIFATHTIFIDSNFNSEGQRVLEGFTLQIVAPTWDIVGNEQYTFNLNGRNGQALPVLKAAQGADGLPGKRGENGGNFVGVGKWLTGSKKFPLVYADGGSGGPGQQGGDGKEGTPGVAADLTTGLAKYFRGRDAEHDMREAILKRGYTCSWQSNNDRPCPKPSSYKWIKCYHFTCEGKIGNPGFAGGKGGKGGPGGNPGTVIIPDFAQIESSSTPLIRANPGQAGPRGRGGSGGVGGMNGPGQYLMFQIQYASEAYEVQTTQTVPATNRGPSGTRGCDDCGAAPSPPPTPPPFYIQYLSTYRQICLEKMPIIYTRENCSEFLGFIDHHSSLQQKREPLWAFNDFTALELDYTRLKEKVDFQGQWESLLDGVYSAVLRLPKGTSQTQYQLEYRKGLSYLYTSIYSRIFSSTHTALESYIVLDMKVYLNNALENFKDLQEHKEKLDRLEIVDKTNQEYQDQITPKFVEANALIENVVNPKIQEILDNIDDVSDNLINEIAALRNATIKDLKSLHAKERELKRQQRLRVLFGAFKIVGTGLSFLGPQGAAAGGLMNSMTGIAEAATMSGGNAMPVLTQIPAAISNTHTALSMKFKKMTQKDIETYEAQLAHVSAVLKGESTESSPSSSPSVTSKPPDPAWTAITEKVESTQQKLKYLKDRINAGVAEFDAAGAGGSDSIDRFADLNDLQTLYKESHAELQLSLETQTKLEQAKYKKDKSERNLKLFDKMQKASAVFSAGLEVYSKYKDDQNKLEIIRGQITETEDTLQQIEEKEINVSYMMKPMLEGMRQDLKETQELMGTQSAIALEVGRWQVQSTLKELKKALREEFTAGFAADSQMVEAFDNLQDALTTLTNVYDRLQGYSEQAKLAKFIATINSAQFSNVVVKDGPLNAAIQTVDLILKANVIKQQYEFALKSFTTWMFPFAHFFLGQFSLPPNMTDLVPATSSLTSTSPSVITLNPLSTTTRLKLDDLLFFISSRLSTLSTQLTLFHSTMEEIHSVLFSNVEFYDTSATDAFYTWDSSSFSHQIKDILTGREVFLTADILKSPLDIHAVKFGRIDLDFKKSGNGNVTDLEMNALNSYLNYFRVKITHMGNSFYKYETRIFQVTTKSVEMVYTVLKRPDGTPTDKNDNFDKLRAGYFSLSPYTLWRVKLEPAKSIYKDATKVPGFDSVKDIFEKLDLQLVGTGSRVDAQGYSAEQLELQDYYNEDISFE